MMTKHTTEQTLLSNQAALLVEWNELLNGFKPTIDDPAITMDGNKTKQAGDGLSVLFNDALLKRAHDVQMKLQQGNATLQDFEQFERAAFKIMDDALSQQRIGPQHGIQSLFNHVFSMLTTGPSDSFLHTRLQQEMDYFHQGLHRLKCKYSLVNRPLIIASSGGGGHISAAKGIVDDLQARKNVDILLHAAVRYVNRPISFIRHVFQATMYAKSAASISAALGFVHQQTGIPDVLDYEQINQEIHYLKTDTEKQLTRPYIDLLLDYYALGYEMAAIFNGLQRQDKIKELNALVGQQGTSDRLHALFIYEDIQTLLSNQEQTGRPYSSVISTQPQSLAAICDAVLWYNKTYKPSTKMRVAQYMTDLPTAGATHFLRALERLRDEQRECMDVYCLGTPDSKFTSLNKLNVFSLRPEENPMLRAGFRQTAKLIPYTNRDQEQTLLIQVGDVLQQQVIPAQAYVASIMLGSLGGDASMEYVLPLLENGYTHLFLFGMKGNKKLEALMHELTPSQQACIIPLGNQGDETIAPIMTRSDCVITRSGGLSTMEQMALPLIANKRVLIHHKNPQDHSVPLSAGLSWEDGNADCLIAHLELHGAEAKKTCPARAWADIPEVGPQVVRPLLF